MGSASLFVVALIIWLASGGPGAWNGHSEKVQIIFGTVLSTAVCMFVLGWLTRLTRPQPPTESQGLAHEKATDLLQKIAQSKVGHVLTGGNGSVVRIAKVIDVKTPELQMYKPILEDLYELTPACLLPRYYGEKDTLFLDWHKYDLCIVAAREDQHIAREVRERLLRQNNQWKIYFDEINQGALGENQESFVKRIFFGSSSHCLVLLSSHMVSNVRRRLELNYALQREQREEDACRGYLKPIPIDDHGLRFMKKDPYLRRYATGVEVVHNQNDLCNAIVNKLCETLYPHTPENIFADPRPVAPQAPRRFAIALSFPGERRPFVEQVADELIKRLAREKVFYDRNFEAELARPDMDAYLQAIYRQHAELVVVFLCAEYEAKTWCKLEWRAVRDTLGRKRADNVMPVRFDETHVDGLFAIDGYVNVGNRQPTEIADLIMQRLKLNREAQLT